MRFCFDFILVGDSPSVRFVSLDVVLLDRRTFEWEMAELVDVSLDAPNCGRSYELTESAVESNYRYCHRTDENLDKPNQG